MRSTRSAHRTWVLVASTVIVGGFLAGCSAVAAPETAPSGVPSAEPAAPEPQTAPTSEIEAAAALALTRWELVRDGDYEGACALYSEKFIQNLLQLAEAEGKS